MASSLLYRVRALEREALESGPPPGRCPECAGLVLFVFEDPNSPEARARPLRCKACGADVTERAKVILGVRSDWI